ncbi:transcriptional regulator [Actinomadura sp. LD22]|uniref:Transcriptional regulator n=1 Tax=Actinomadura physcomitrii TaxID=2650748 RepID=A0A6I4M609_9ACTN|nr:helix-turn-helix domain-containing protein [Actinomadura physcomitrii]MVZ99210.1 transcriptional regulator [Actinomadura physcomitrii]
MDDVFRRDCPARVVLDHVTRRWGVLVLTALDGSDLRFYELRDRIEGVSEKMLSQTLRTLVRDGLVLRTVEPTVPPSVTYALTPLGRGLTTSLRTLTTWIRDHAGEIITAQRTYDGISVE